MQPNLFNPAVIHLSIVPSKRVVHLPSLSYLHIISSLSIYAHDLAFTSTN
jgi:hypothetical protein